MVTGGVTSVWQLVTHRGLQDQCQELVSSQIFITSLEDYTSTHGRALCYAGGVAGLANGRASVQREPAEFQNQTGSSLMRFNPERCRALCVGQSKPQHLCRLGCKQWSSCPAQKGPTNTAVGPSWMGHPTYRTYSSFLWRHLIWYWEAQDKSASSPR